MLTRRSFLTGAVVLGSGLLLLPVATVGGHPQKLWMLAGVDRSRSNQPNLGLHASWICAGALQLLEADWMTLYRVDSNCREIWDAAPPTSDDRFKHDLARELRPDPAHRGTRPALFFKAVADRMAANPDASLRIVVLLFGDGDHDDATLAATFRNSVVRIGADPRVVRIACVGVNPANREALRKRFSFVPHDRFDLRGSSDFEIQTLAQWISDARN